MAAICGQEIGTKKESLARPRTIRPASTLMIGDAPGDYEAAQANQALFFPINPGGEEPSWKRLYEEGIDRFLAGTFAGWLMDIMERAKTTNAEKIIQTWEGDTYRTANGRVYMMRGCDHKSIMDLSAEVYLPPDQQKATFTIPPYYWYKDASFTGEIHKLPAGDVLPWMDPKLDRCKGKNGWGE